MCLGYDPNKNFLYHKLRPEITRHGTAKRPVCQLIWQLRPLSLPSNFNMCAEVRNQLFGAFMSRFFAPNKNVNGRDDSLYLLMAHFPTVAGESEVFDRSAMALVCSFLANDSNDRYLEHQGLEIYNSALNAMVCGLQHKSGVRIDMLYASILLHTREVRVWSSSSIKPLIMYL